MEFRVLGPLEVHERGRRLPLRGPRQLALLAALLLRANATVPEERLLEELWGDAQPRSGSAALRVRVSQMRRALDTPRVLVTRAGGYELRVEPDALDAARF